MSFSTFKFQIWKTIETKWLNLTPESENKRLEIEWPFIFKH